MTEETPSNQGNKWKEVFENFLYASIFNIILFPFLIFVKITLNQDNLLTSLVELAAIQFGVVLIIFLVYTYYSKGNNCFFCLTFLLAIILGISLYLVFTEKLDIMGFLIIFSYCVSYLIIEFVRNIFMKFKNWIFSDSSNDKLVKNKLSFINKIIVGFLSVVATIISILISLKQLH